MVLNSNKRATRDTSYSSLVYQWAESRPWYHLYHLSTYHKDTIHPAHIKRLYNEYGQ